MTTPTELCNMALAHLGQARISDYSERSPAAEHCRRAFDHTRRLCLRDYDWNFAIRRAILTAAEAAPAFDWGYSYPLPEDCLRVLSVNQRPGGTRLTDYAVEGRSILTNSAECRVRYVADATDVTDWDSVFCSYFAYRLAAAIAPSLRLDPQAGQQMEQMAAAIRDQAREADAVESQPRVTRLDQSEILEEREGRMSAWYCGGGSGGTTPGGTATWGSIGGTLADQADLVAALAGKAAVSHTHSADQIVSGTFPAARFAGTATDTYVLALVAGVPTWSVPGGGTPGSGDVVGPASSVNNTLPRFSGTSGKLLKSSTVAVTDAGNIGVDSITLSTSPSTAIATGVIRYDADETAIAVGIDGITAEIPMQEFVRVYNDSATTLTKGQPVYVSGAQGNRTAVKLADASSESTSAGTIGLVAQTIAAGATGLVQRAGPMRNLNTNGFTAGALLYLSETTGQITQTPPAAPAHAVRIGWVERVSSTVGIILIKVDNGYELNELHDVLISAPQEGQILTWDSLNEVWVNSNNQALFVTGTATEGYFVVADAFGNGIWTQPSDARTALGLGTMATQASSNVSITGGTIAGITDLALADGGTGASDAAGARTNLQVPSITDLDNQRVDIQTFGGPSSSGNFTWTKPAGAKFVIARIVGSGAGGVGGLCRATSADRPGGAGGGAGAMSIVTINASELGSTVAVGVGAGGAGGAGSSSTVATYNAGTNGQLSNFGSYVSLGGSRSTTNAAVAGRVGSAFNLLVTGFQGASGAGGTGTVSPPAPGTGGDGSGTTQGLFVAGGGGGGGGAPATETTSAAGGAGGGRGVGAPPAAYNVALAGGTGGTTGGTAAGNGLNQDVPQACGTGGGGGFYISGQNGGNGGNGGWPGGGGGGGGGADSGLTSGSGGNGANGMVQVITFF